MAGTCTKCKANTKSYITDSCACCTLLENDTEPKPVWWCAVCKVYLCDRCRKAPLRRIRAWGKQFFT